MRSIAGRTFVLRPLAVAALGVLALASGPTHAQPPNAVFKPLRPCRVVDSRINQGTTGALLPGQVRPVTFRGLCGIPGLTTDGGREANQAQALALNVVAVTPSGPGHINAWPSNQFPPSASTLNYSPGETISNGVIVPMCDQNLENPCPTGDISFQAAVSAVHLVVDVTGYYAKPTLNSNRSGAGPGYDNLLCVNTSQDVRFGLSYRMGDLGSAESLCPAGTWLCSRLERGYPNQITCNTSRNDHDCDALNCAGGCIDAPANNHRGWVNTEFAIASSGETVDEDGLVSHNLACEHRPAWCCSRDD